MAQTATAPRQTADQGGAPPPAQPPQQNGAAPAAGGGGGGPKRTKTVEVDRVVGTFHDPEMLNGILQNAHAHYHLVSPATVCPTLPEGFSVIAMLVRVDLLTDCAPADETAKGEAKNNVPAAQRVGVYQLSKHMLNRLANAAGVTMDPPVRKDDRRHPHVVEYETTAHWQTFDLQPIERTGAQRADLRDGSDEIVGWSDRRIQQERATILAKVQTKSELRAIRAILGVKVGFSPEELRKPFLVVKLIADTSRIEDPETRKVVLLERMRRAMGGHRVMFASEMQQATQLHVTATPTRALPPGQHQTSRGAVDVEPEADTFDGRPPAQPPRQQQRRERPLKMPGKKGDPRTGIPIENAETKDLEYWVGRIAKNLGDDSSQDPAHDKRLLEAMQAELLKRGNGGGEGFGDDDGGDFGDDDIPEDIFRT